MNETFQIYFATSVRNSNCDLGERVVRHLDVEPTEPAICQGGGGAFAPSNFWLLWKKKNFHLQMSFMATTAPRVSSKLLEIPSGLQMADSGCRGRGLFFNYVDKKRWVNVS